MLGLILAGLLSVYFAHRGFVRACQHKKNTILWPMLLVGCFLVTHLIIANLTIIVLSQFVSSLASAFVIGFIALAVSLGSAFLITSALLDSKLQEVEIEEANPFNEQDQLLIDAVFEQDEAKVAELLRSGANARATDQDGYSAFDYALLKKGNIEALVRQHLATVDR